MGLFFRFQRNNSTLSEIFLQLFTAFSEKMIQLLTAWSVLILSFSRSVFSCIRTEYEELLCKEGKYGQEKN